MGYDAPMTQASSATANLPDRVRDQLQTLLDDLQRHRHRALLVLQQMQAVQQAEDLLQAFNLNPVLRVSDQLEQALPPARARTQLGREYRAILFDARRGDFDADGFGAVAGTLCGGGVLLLLLPEADPSSIGNTPFMQRLRRILNNHPAAYQLTDDGLLPAPKAENGVAEAITVPAPFRTPDQQQAVADIIDAACATEARPLLLVSDRGRGKTAALGLAAAELLQQTLTRILVTAPRLTVAEPLFEHAATQLGGAVRSRAALHWQDRSLAFVAPDALLQETPEADLLLVDEAAAIPLTLLQQLLDHYPRVVFASTIHGYEGTGRGFALKFRQLLDRQAPGWRELTLGTPIRWATGDGLEACIDRLLCLDAELAEPPAAIRFDECRVESIATAELLDDDDHLSALFALLVSAHYRTRPADLRQLLDDPALRIYGLFQQQHLLGAALVSEEGGFDAELGAAIHRGERRPPGHLLAQTLSFHAGDSQAAQLTYARIMRIAIHPQLQRRGLGGRLLQAVIEREQDRVDAIGTSFAATADLLRFWQQAELWPVRIGFSRDHVSGLHAAVMLRPCSAAGQQLCRRLRRRFQQSIGVWLQDSLGDLDPDLQQALLSQCIDDDSAFSAEDAQQLLAYARGERGMEASLWPLKKLLRDHGDRLALLEPEQAAVIRARLQDGLDWAHTAQLTGCRGRAEAQQLMREGVADWLAGLQA